MESILSKIAEYTIEPIGRLFGRQVGYVLYCKTNFQNMQAKVEELKAARQAIENQVAEAERKGEKIQPDVQLWLTKVDEITAQADELLTDESQAKLKCLHGFCPNLTVRHQLSRKSTKLVEEVVEHSAKRLGFSQVSCGILRKEVWGVTTGDYQPFQSRMSKVKEIMDHLKDSKTERMGVCGVGGVGKTTLVKEIYKLASEDKTLFDDVVILLDVKRDPNLEAIQKIIMEQLGMEILQTETKVGRASRLCGRIQGKKVLVILDDVQEKIDLEAVGLPRLPTCKFLLTCRTRQVFDEMRVDKVFQLDLLDKQDTWNLFVKMAGDVINQDGVRDVAIKVAERCGGLPLLVVTVASALKRKNKLQSWRDALRRLKGFDKEELTEKAYLALEWSYDQLDDKELKPLFLLCGVIVMQNDIDVQDLLKYGMGLRLFQNVNTVAEARDALDSLLEKLKDSCLLLDSDVEDKVRMHDLVCHVAKRIAYRDQQALSVEYGGELKEWPDKDFLRKCTKISLPRINIPTLSEIPLEFPELEFFFWCCTYHSEEIPSNFFREMQKLKVLVLSGMSMPSLPLSLQYLKKLRTLCLDDWMGDITLIGQLSNLEILSITNSELKELPKEVGQLTRLRLLDLSYCRQLEVIPPTVISCLVRLEDLRMRFSFDKWDVEGEGSNASILELKHLSQLSALDIYIPNADVLRANLFSHKLERFDIFIGDGFFGSYPWREVMAETTLNTLKLKLTKSIKELDEGLKLLLKRSKFLCLDETEVVIINQLNTEDFENLKHLQLQNSVADIINRKVVFPNLSTLSVHRCDNLRFLFSFSMARSLVQLTRLQISSCKLMQEIVSSTRECCETDMDNMFSTLQILNLKGLPNLARFGMGNYIEFSSLEELKIKDCYDLGQFIGDKVMSSEDTIIGKEIEQRVLEEEDNQDVKSEIVVQYFLFNERVGFPSLERLSIEGIRKVKAIWHDQLAQDSFRRLKQVEVERCDNLISFFPPSVMGRLNASIASSPNPDQLNYYQNLDSIHIYMCNRLKNIFPASVARGLQQLTQLNVSYCSGIEEIVFKEEEEEAIETTPLEIVSSTKECGEANMDNMFSKLKVLNLEKLPNLVRFGTGNFIEFSSLEELKINDCDELVEFIGDKVSMSSKDTIICKEIEQRVLGEEDNHDVKSEIVVPYFLFSKKVGFPSLERLSIKGIRKVNAIGHFQLGQDSFRRLKQVDVQQCDNLISLFLPSVMGRLNASYPNHDQLKPFDCQNLDSINICECDSLKNIFPASIARGLQQLTRLSVEDCFGIEEIVGEEMEEVLDITPSRFVFPKVTSVTLLDLPQLRRFYPRLHASRWPLLETVNVVRCAKVGIFAAEFSMFGENREMDSLMSQQPLFIIDKDSFLNLEHLVLSSTANEIWNGPTPSELVFGKLKSFTFYGKCAPLSKQAWVLFLGRLQNLEKIEMRWSSSSSEEIFVNRGISSSSRGDIRDDDDAIGSGTFPRVRILKLQGMYELMHLGYDNSQSAAASAAASPVRFPNLEILEVECCERLKTLGSLSAISFRNLTTLIVGFCEGLEYLTTYSAAKSLVQLTTLKVSYCGNILVIVASNDEDDAAAGNINEIAFSRLQHVELYELPRLQGFCAGKCRLPPGLTLKIEGCPIIKLNISVQGTGSFSLVGSPNQEFQMEVRSLVTLS